jgi:hypothetical protein
MLLVALALTLAQAAPPGGPLTPAASRFHLVRSLSGAKGAPEKNRFVFEDQRSVFQAGLDRQVLVLFEWEGPLGVHHCEGRWKDPSGRVVLTSQNDAVARSARFGVYWGLSLADVVATGTWVIEAFVDGEPAGAHAFQIVAGGAGAPGMPSRRALSLTELYQRGLATTLTLDSLDAAGALRRRGSAMLVGTDLVQSTFAMVNAARRVRVKTPDGRPLESSEVVSWDSGENRATLRVPGVSGPALTLASEPVAVGDRLFFLDASQDGTRVIIDTAAVGRSPAGDLVLGQPASDAAEGAPVFDEFGEIVATIVGQGVLGADALDEYALERPLRIGPSQSSSPGGARARPLTALPEAKAASKTLLELEQAGVFVKPLARSEHFVNGVMGTGIGEQSGIPFATGQGFRFSRAERSCVVFTTWVGRRKQDAPSALEMYDGANHKIWASRTETVKLRSGQTLVRYWTLALAPLTPGIYRLDLTLGPDPVWRTFFRVTE